MSDGNGSAASAATNETPLIWTSKGNVPIDSLRYEHEWREDDQYIFFLERWFDGEELVKNNTHGYVKQGVTMGGAQGVTPS